jgi:protein-S-isoprenylcysteine O-methyltransferase Ste14
MTTASRVTVPILSRRSPARYLWGVIPILLGLPALLAVGSVALERWLGVGVVFGSPAGDVVGAGVLAIGLLLWLWSPVLLLRRGRGIPIEDKDGPVFDGGTKQLVCTGPYRHTRNPMYTGYLSSIAGVGILIDSPILVLVVVPAWFVWTYYFVVRYEERALRARFGAEYERYCRNVRRFLPRLTPWVPSA